MNIFTTLVRHPGLFRKWLPFGGKLLAGKLPARDRELLILRTGLEHATPTTSGTSTCASPGRRASPTTRSSGCRPAPTRRGGRPFDALLLRAADELHVDACITDATWAALAARYDERQMIELPMLVGHYHMVAFALNSLGVQVEDDASSRDGRTGGPHRRSSSAPARSPATTRTPPSATAAPSP